MSLKEIDWTVYPLKVTRDTGEVYYVYSSDEIEITTDKAGVWYFTQRPSLKRVGMIARLKKAYEVIRHGYI